MHSPKHMEFSFAVFHLLGTIFLYKIRRTIGNKLNYYLISGTIIGVLCLLIFLC